MFYVNLMCVCVKFGFYFMSSKRTSSHYSKGTEVFGSKSSNTGSSEIGIVHKSTVFIHGSSGRKNLLLTSLLFPLGEKDK